VLGLAAESRGTVAVFGGPLLAFALSTALAALLGRLLGETVLREYCSYIRYFVGTLFIGIGVFYFIRS